MLNFVHKKYSQRTFLGVSIVFDGFGAASSAICINLILNHNETMDIIACDVFLGDIV